MDTVNRAFFLMQILWRRSLETAMARHLESQNIDLLVIGAYGHSRIRTMIFDSTTTQLLRTCETPMLLLR